MFHLEISYEERDVLRQLLEHSLATIELEIQHTDHQDFKSMLKQRRETVRGLLLKLPHPVGMAA